jgi:hypothetical protein
MSTGARGPSNPIATEKGCGSFTGAARGSCDTTSYARKRGRALHLPEIPPEVIDPDTSTIDPALALPIGVIAGLLLVAREHLRAHEIPAPTVKTVLAATGAGRTQAYEYRDRIAQLLREVARPPGRPRHEPSPPSRDDRELTRAVLAYVTSNPGCTHGDENRRRYSETMRRFVLGLRDSHSSLDLKSFAEAVMIPAATLADWIRGERTAVITPPPASPAPTMSSTIPRVESILDAWSRWNGDFGPFCSNVQVNLQIPYGRTQIASILESHGARTPDRRPKRSPDEKALRDSFEIFFPGAQWVGDGRQTTVMINGDSFVFNVELHVDAASGAFVGATVSDEEDAAAVVQAFADGVVTTGAPPVALLLDNKPSNHSAEVAASVEPDTVIMASTPARPQNKAHVEGAFGLFQQTAPPLSIQGENQRELAGSFLRRVVQTFGRAINHRPRADRRGRSRIELYRAAAPTPEQTAAAKEAFAKRIRERERAAETRRRREDPVVRATIDAAFARLGLADPTTNIRSAIARYDIDAVTAAIAIFDGKRAAGTLPPNVDRRYLLGITRNISERREAQQIADALLRARLEARDVALALLVAEQEAIVSTTHDAATRMHSFVDAIASCTRVIGRNFWVLAAGRLLTAAPEGDDVEERTGLLRAATRRVFTSRELAHAERLDIVRRLTESAVPLL